MSKIGSVNRQAEQDAFLGTVPILSGKRIYSFIDAFLVLSGYCIATWSYTHGDYLTTLVGFRQLLISVFFGAILALIIYQLPVILSVRYGIDIWVWLRSVFGYRGVKVMSVIIIIINFPWYAVCAELFASSMTNLAGVFGIVPPSWVHLLLALFCVWLGTAMALRGVQTITTATRFLVPVLLLSGVLVITIATRAVPFSEIWNYRPDISAFENPTTPYIMSLEANFAFVITLVGGMSGIPRLTKTERSGFWAGVLGQGLSGSLFVVVGAVISIAMQISTGVSSDDPTKMLMTLSAPVWAVLSLLLVAFANVGTQAVGSYIYGVMLKSTFQKTKYHLLVIVLGIYISVLCVWGGVSKYFGSFLTISASIYAPLAALLFADFFFVRKQRISLRSAFSLENHKAYRYTSGFQIVGLLCVVFGMCMSLLIYNPVTGEVRNSTLFHATPTGFSFLSTAILYTACSRVPAIRKYMLSDRKELSI